MPAMQKVMGDGVEIQLGIWPGKGRAVFCVHGLTANWRFWNAMAQALSPKHEVIAMDLRGRGLSGKPRWGYSVKHHCRDIRSIMVHLGLERVALIGHSLGAVIVLACAAMFPDLAQCLILVDGGGKLTARQSARVIQGITPSLRRLGQVYPSFEDYIGVMKALPFFWPWSSDLDAYFRYDVEEVDGGVRSRISRAQIYQELLNLQKTDVAGFYPKIACPTLILRATEGMLRPDDILLPHYAIKRMLRQIPNVRCVDIEGTNHYTIGILPNEERDRTVENFLDQYALQDAG